MLRGQEAIVLSTVHLQIESPWKHLQAIFHLRLEKATNVQNPPWNPPARISRQFHPVFDLQISVLPQLVKW